MACAAIPMTVVLFMQAVLMVVGIGFSHDTDGGVDSDDADFDSDSDADFNAGFDAETDADVDIDASAEVSADYDFSEPGAGHGFSDVHEAGASHDGLHHAGSHSSGLKVFTVRGIVAFFAIGGWSGLAALTSGVRPLWSVQISLVTGAAAMLLASIVIRFALRMQSSGNIDLRNAISQTAEVYITIPPSRSNTGRITMILQERFVEVEAVTDSPAPLKTNTKVEVVGLADGDCLVVKKLDE